MVWELRLTTCTLPKRRNAQHGSWRYNKQSYGRTHIVQIHAGYCSTGNAAAGLLALTEAYIVTPQDSRLLIAFLGFLGQGHQPAASL